MKRERNSDREKSERRRGRYLWPTSGLEVNVADVKDGRHHRKYAVVFVS